MYEHPTIYLELNITATKKKVKEHINAYNVRMMAEYPDDHGKRTLKNMHVSSAMHIIDAYYAHLKNQAKLKTRTPMPFKLNNQALATMLAGTTVKRTAANHINRLIDAGVIAKKFFLGTNTGYLIMLNMELLEAMPNDEFRQKIDEGYQQCINNGGIDDPENRQKVQNLTPSFSVFLSGMGKLFPDIVERTLQELNINMQGGIVDNRASTAPQDAQINNAEMIDSSASSAIKQEHLQEPGVHTNAAVDAKGSAADVNPDKKNSAPAAPSNEEIASRELILNYVGLAWNFMIANLYDGRTFSINDEIASEKLLKKYFQDNSASPNKMAEAFNNFLLRVILARKYALRNPDRFIPTPRVWLDPTFKYGFSGTETWLTAVNKKYEAQKEYYSNVKLVATLYRQFAANPGIFDFVSARQTLGKFKNKEYLKMFDEAVIKHPMVKDIYQKMTTING